MEDEAVATFQFWKHGGQENDSTLDENIFFIVLSGKATKEEGNQEVDVTHFRRARKRSRREENLSRK